jgi:type VI secretion system ImpJ/VasE family protein
MEIQIHWEEGLFLQQHHLQRAQKLVGDTIIRERKLSCTYPYGLIHAQEKQDDLEKLTLRFERLHAVMPSGTEVSFPDAADLPPLDLRNSLSTNAITVYLAVPLWLEGRPNVELSNAEGPRAKLAYRTYEKECKDENDGEKPKTVLFRRVNARLTLDATDPDLEVIPLLRISRTAGLEFGVPRVEYHGPNLILNGALKEMVVDLATQVEVSRSELVSRIQESGRWLDIMRRPELEQLLRLRTLNRFAGRLPFVSKVWNALPFEMYLELRELLGELCALQADQSLFEIPPYNHDQPNPAFLALNKNVRMALGTSTGPRYIKVDFAKVNGRYRAELEERHFVQPTDYFLGVENVDVSDLAQLVKNQDVFKFVPRSMEDTPIRGMQIEDVRAGGLPLVLPARQGLHYFHVLVVRSDSRAWEDIRRQRAASICWPGDRESGMRFTLYMILPAEMRENSLS